MDNYTSSSFFANITQLIYNQRDYSNFKEILAEITKEARAIIKVDRIQIYQFASDGSGQVIAEAVEEDRLPSILGLHFPETDIPLQAKQSMLKYTKGTVIDVTAKRKIAYSQSSSLTGLTEDTIYQTVDPCHIQYLLTMGVLSSLAMPIFHWDELWGLLVGHHSEPYRFSQQELVLSQLLSKQISLALNQETLIIQSLAEQKQQETINQINEIWCDYQGSNQQTWSLVLATIIKQLNRNFAPSN